MGRPKFSCGLFSEHRLALATPQVPHASVMIQAQAGPLADRKGKFTSEKFKV